MIRKPPPRYLTPKIVAAYFDVSPMTVYRLIHEGDLPAIKVGRSYRVPVSALEGYAEAHPASAGGAA